ncbi:DUF342 domain-containing protein [Aeromonas bivalvium]|uniref:DUF342 domain-containing protein n=1 Tax=Aeromonas bivalvium TaxID=440079 RepID=UPI0038D227D1
MLNKEWLQLSADMELACLRILPGLDEPVREADVLTLLLSSNCRRYQPLHEGIKQVVSLLNTLQAKPDAAIPPNPVPIARRQDARLMILVDSDKMTARAQITCDWGGKPLTLDALQQALGESEVNSGVQGILLEQAVKLAREGAPGSLIQPAIAYGIAPIAGQDTRFERLVDTPSDRILKPQETENGKVDLRDLGTLVTVRAGEPLMRRHPATQGSPGLTVTGQTLPVKPGKELAMVPGVGTEIASDDPNLLLASRPGLPCLEKQGMRVDDVLSLKQVDARSGHVTFEGALIISGDVFAGMRIRASGDVVIGGFVEGADIESGGAITVRHGVIGRKTEDDDPLCRLSAQGEIHAAYAQYARLEAGGNIHIQTQLTHCHTRSGQDLRVGDSAMRKGTLLGGISIANRQIQAPSIGASAANHTRLQILGGYFSHKQQEQELKQRKQSCRDQLLKVQDLLLKLLQLPREKRNPETLDKIKTLRQQYLGQSKGLDAKLDEAQQALQQLLGEMEITATQRLYAGVEVELANSSYRVDIDHGPIRIAFKQEQIVLQPLEGRK